jgi:hypothetical protein
MVYVQNLAWKEDMYLVKLSGAMEDGRLDALHQKKHYVPATVLTDTEDGVAEVVDKTYRYHDHLMEMDEQLAKDLFTAVSHYLPKTQKDEDDDEWTLDCVNPLMRYLHYSPGQFFGCHIDDYTYLESTKQRSFITLQLYLSNNTEGATNFYKVWPIDNDKPDVQVFPSIGDIVLFEHELRHEGALLKTEHKYSLRTDILYTLKSETQL